MDGIRAILKALIISIFLVIIMMFQGCKTIDLEKNANTVSEEKTNEALFEKKETIIVNEITDVELNEKELPILGEHLEEEAEEEPIVYTIEEPEIIYTQTKSEPEVLTGAEALKQLQEDKTVIPEYSNGELKGWIYKEQSIYQVHCQTYHSTIIQLEPGEELMEVPYISEPDTWKLSIGVGQKNGLATQFLILKPDCQGMTTTMIIITNYRVYQLDLRSYNDHYMPYVSWIYPQSIEIRESYQTWQKNKQQEQEEEQNYEYIAQSMEFLSFDYKISYFFLQKKPVWCPTLVYDDGRRTYIVLDKKVLQMSMPSLSANKKEIINYQVSQNVIIINELIEEVTLQLDNQKVTITKKKG